LAALQSEKKTIGKSARKGIKRGGKRLKSKKGGELSCPNQPSKGDEVYHSRKREKFEGGQKACLNLNEKKIRARGSRQGSAGAISSELLQLPEKPTRRQQCRNRARQNHPQGKTFQDQSTGPPQKATLKNRSRKHRLKPGE